MIVPAATEKQRDLLIKWLAQRLDLTPELVVGTSAYEAVAVMRKGVLMGAVLYTNYREPTIEMACAGNPGWLTRADLRDLFAHAFNHEGVWTVLTNCGRRRTDIRDFNKKLGFIELCVVRGPPGSGTDTCLYGMTRDRCPWLDAPARPARHASNGVAAHG